MPNAPEYSNEQIAIYTAFKQEVFNPKSVLYPCCGYDASPSKVFENVTYVDIDTLAMDLFKQFGLRAFGQDVKYYKPAEEHDLLILLNSTIPTEWAAQHIISGAFILTNDWLSYKNATEMHNNPDKYTLLGVIDFVEKDRRKGDNRFIVSRDIADLFVPVKSGEELRRLRPADYGLIKWDYPHLLRTNGVEPAETFEEMYAQFQTMMKLPRQLPAKRVAERYIFVKR